MLKGYKTLSEDNKNIFNEFMGNFKMKVELVSIYYVGEVEYYIMDNEDMLIIGGRTEIINNDSTRLLLDQWFTDGFHGEFEANKEKQYLRFDYKVGDSKEWLHIINAKEWY
jgi:hypothetical protein